MHSTWRGGSCNIVLSSSICASDELLLAMGGCALLELEPMAVIQSNRRLDEVPGAVSDAGFAAKKRHYGINIAWR